MFIDYYDMDFNWLDITLQNHLHNDAANKKPDNWSELKMVAKQLASDFPFVRVDLYDIGGTIYLSELTFIPTGGYMSLSPGDVLYEWGSWLSIRSISDN